MSWVIVKKETKEVIIELFEKKNVERINTGKYKAVPTKKYLEEFNKEIQENSEEKINR